MTDERIERLTKLARKAWPGVVAARVRTAFADRHEVSVETADYHRVRLMVDHPRALDALEAALLCLNGQRWHGDLSELLPELAAEKARADGAEAERDRLRKLFDDAGQGEHNVLALVDHYQDGMIAAEARAEALFILKEEAERARKEALASVERRHMDWDTRAWSTVERELRALKLIVCHEVTPADYQPVWEGEDQDGWSLVQAVDELKARAAGGET